MGENPAQPYERTDGRVVVESRRRRIQASRSMWSASCQRQPHMEANPCLPMGSMPGEKAVLTQ
eukprot:1158508-Pelagomonas_calceolata.AAC.9